MKMSKDELADMIRGMLDELGQNTVMFSKVPHDRLAKTASVLFALCTRLAALSESDMKFIAVTGILRDANDLVKAYNNDKDLKIAV